MVIKLLFQYSLCPKSSDGCQTLKRCIEMLEHRTSGCNTAKQSQDSVACLDTNHQAKIIHETTLSYTMPQQQMEWYSVTQTACQDKMGDDTTLHYTKRHHITLYHITWYKITTHDMTSHRIPLHEVIPHHMARHCTGHYYVTLYTHT
jgi:hypothetical protein